MAELTEGGRFVRPRVQPPVRRSRRQRGADPRELLAFYQGNLPAFACRDGRAEGRISCPNGSSLFTADSSPTDGDGPVDGLSVALSPAPTAAIRVFPSSRLATFDPVCPAAPTGTRSTQLSEQPHRRCGAWSGRDDTLPRAFVRLPCRGLTPFRPFVGVRPHHFRRAEGARIARRGADRACLDTERAPRDTQGALPVRGRLRGTRSGAGWSRTTGIVRSVFVA